MAQRRLLDLFRFATWAIHANLGLEPTAGVTLRIMNACGNVILTQTSANGRFTVLPAQQNAMQAGMSYAYGIWATRTSGEVDYLQFGLINLHPSLVSIAPPARVLGLADGTAFRLASGGRLSLVGYPAPHVLSLAAGGALRLANGGRLRLAT